MTSQEEILDIYQKFTDEFDVKQALLNLMESYLRTLQKSCCNDNEKN